MLKILILVLMLAGSLPCLGAQPCPCARSAAVANDDAADIGEAFARGVGDRMAIGPYRGLTWALRQARADVTAGRTDAGDRYAAAIQAEVKINPQRACTIATFAVIGLEMANAFGANIPATVIAEAVALEQQICGASKSAAKPVPVKLTLAPITNWLSPQFILDGCAGSNGGCSGDDNTTVLANAKNMGIPREADYVPYVGYSQGCQTMAGTGVSLYTVSDWGYADSSTTGVAATNLIKAAILKYGGVGCAVAADGSFMGYSGGVFSGNANGVNHDVYQVGWDDATGAWLMINSWGSAWGIDPTTGKSVLRQGRFLPTGLKLPPPNVRAALHAASRRAHMRAEADLAKIAQNLPASYNALASQPPIADQGQCGSCWDFSGCRMVSAANILAGTLPKSTAPISGGCMWISYGSNQIGTEAVWCVAGTPVPYTPNPNPNPPQPSPTRRAAVLMEKATRLYGAGVKEPVLKALKAAEDVLQTAN